MRLETMRAPIARAAAPITAGEAARCALEEQLAETRDAQAHRR